jgi:mRNA interferase HicA
LTFLSSPIDLQCERRDLIGILRQTAKDQGVEYSEVEGGSHTKVVVGNRLTVVPRHSEVNERTAQSIIKQISGEQ